MQTPAAVRPLFLDFGSQSSKLSQLSFFFFQVAFDLRDRIVGLLDLSGVLLALLSGVGYVAPRAFHKLGQLLRALPIELNAAPVGGDVALQLLHCRAGIGDVNVELVQVSTLFGEGIFAAVDLRARRSLACAETLDFLAASGQFAFQRIQLFARVMCFEHAQVSMQCLIAARFPCLSLQRADLTLYLFDDVANTQEVCLSGLQLAECFALLRLVFCDSGRLLENRAPIFRTRT